MTTIYLVRHAQAEGNLYRRCHGWNNGLITEKGRQQMDLLEQRFQGIHLDAVYSSDLYRAMTTATALTRSRGLRLRLDPGLREIHAGIREDRPWGEWLHEDRENLAAFLRCDPNWSVQDSETFPGLQARVTAAVARIAAAHDGETIAMVSHGCAIRAAVSAWRGVPVDAIGTTVLGDNTCVAKLEYDGGQIKLCYYNDDSHLGPRDNQVVPAFREISKVEAMAKTALRFAPLSFPEDRQLYLDARAEGYMASHGTMDCFDGPAFLEVAERNASRARESVLSAWLGDTFAGVLQLDLDEEAEQSVGRVPFLYMTPETRSRGLGVQLVGQAVSVYRKLGRRYLRLRCAPENEHAQMFYRALGFRKTGEVPGGTGTLDTMEKYIGPEL